MGNLGKLNIVISAVNKTQKVFNTVKKGLNGVKNAVGKALKAFGFLTASIGALGGALTILFKKSFDFLDVIGKIATRTGATTDLIQAFQLSAIQSGASIETTNKALQKFAKMVGEARTGLKTYTDIFKRNNVALLDAQGNTRSFNDILLDTMTGLSKNADEFQRNRDLAQLFGRAGQELTNTIMMGGEAFAIFIQKQKELGNIISGRIITATEQFNDRLSRIGFSIRVIRDAFTTAFLPVLDDLAEKFETTLANINAAEFGKQLAISLLRGLQDTLLAIDEFRMAFETNFASMSEIAATLSIAVNNLTIAFEGLSVFFTRGLRTEIAQENIRKLREENDKLRESFGKEVLPSEIIQKLVDGLGTTIEKIKGFGKETEETLIEMCMKPLSRFQIMIQELAANAQVPLKTFQESFKSTGEMIGDTIVSSMKKFEDTLVDGLMSGKFAFKDFANFVIKELLRIAIRKLIIDKITGGFTSFLGGLGRERGGTVTANKPYIVGEAGAELFVPNKTGTIIPNNRLGGGMGSGGMPVNITYNIQAFDSKDTISAITENAPTISAIIESEFNKRGKRGFLT